MRLTSVDRLVPGERLARPIYDGKGRILVGTGVPLTQQMIRRLKDLGVYALYVQDPRTDDAEVQEAVSPETRMRAVAAVRDLLEHLRDPRKSIRRFACRRLGRNVRTVVDELVDEVLRNRGVFQQVINIYTADGFLYHHSVNVTILAIALGLECGLEKDRLRELGMGTLLHDVGKLRIPAEVLNKPAALTPEEYELVKRHTVYGFELLRTLDSVSLQSAYVALQHHERIDGSGYPQGLTGDQMHPYSRIAAVADVYDALTAHRIYRPGFLPHEALEHVMAGSGSHYDAGLVELFVRQIAVYPVGQTVRLSTGEVGIVTAVPVGYPQRPKVRILYDPEGRELSVPFERDLLEELSVVVTDVYC